uniref:Uncharacterized protein n=1 Tax=Pristhesancus plagipennis TaxID=1955184 RepID=A0A2K8JX24_PRIPG|nr:secreted hypothetical protein [Pristhesancus plagipennis]
MNRFSLLFILVAVIRDSTGFYFSSASLGGQIQGDQRWQDFDNKFDNSFDDRFSYQAPTHQQYVDYQHQSYQHNSESLRPTQTLLQATQHLIAPVKQK